MPQPNQPDEISELLRERQKTHGDAWKIIGHNLSLMYQQGLLDSIFSTDECYAWIMIFAKLIRATQSPTLNDNWRDVQGYALLAQNDLSPDPIKW